MALARELCSFKSFTPRVRGRAGRAAAELHARAAAPYSRPGWIVRRAGDGFEIWWWDLDRIEPWLANRFGDARPSLAPESLARGTGEGWRVIRTSTGYEAQRWKGGGLLASAWRREAYDPAAWSAFTRTQPAAEDAPEHPPQTLFPTLSADLAPGTAGWRGVAIEDLPRLGAVALATVLVTAGGFWIGQGFRLRDRAADLEQAAEAERATAPRGRAAAAREDARRLAAFRALAARPNPLAGLGVATTILQLYNVAPRGIEAEGDVLTLSLPYDAIDRIDRVAAELEDSGAFVEVRPTTGSGRDEILLRLRMAG